MDERSSGTAEPQPWSSSAENPSTDDAEPSKQLSTAPSAAHEHVQDAAAYDSTQTEDTSRRTAAEYAETFDKAVGVAEQVLHFAPLPAGAKRVATRAMPTVKKVAKVAPMVAPAAEPYVRKAAVKAKEVAPEVAQAAKTGARAVAGEAKAGAKAAADHVRTTAPKLGHAAADKASRIAGKLKRKNDDSGNPPPPS